MISSFRFALPPRGDDSPRDELERVYRAALAAQTVKYAVAPRQCLKLDDGRLLEAGAEVKLTDFRNKTVRIDDGDGIDVASATLVLPAWKQLETLIRSGMVLQHPNWASHPTAAA